MFNRILIILLILSFIIPSLLQANIIHVPGDSTTIQGGINGAVDGDTEMVTPGSYYEHDIDFLGKTITVMGTDPEDSAVVAATVVDADSLGRVFYFHSNEDYMSILSGLTLRGGFADVGGGIYCYRSSPLISQNMIIDNSAIVRGGGIACDSSIVIIRENIIIRNQSDYGGGISCRLCSGNQFTLRNTISENRADCSGGGIQTMNSYSFIANNIITGNSASTNNGGGIYCESNSWLTVLNNVIAGNSAIEHGGGLTCIGNSYLNTWNLILWGNHAKEGKEIYISHLQGPSRLSIGYSDVEGGLASVYVDSACTLNWGNGMIQDDPLFRIPSNNNYHLMAVECGNSFDSPCIDTGAGEDFLLDCDYGLGTMISDLGAYGKQWEQPPTSIENEDPLNDMIPVPRVYALRQNYPNPFNPSTTIAFEIPGGLDSPNPVSLCIYDIHGRCIKTILTSDLNPGSYQITWNGRDVRGELVPSGVYFYTLRNSQEVLTRKMTLVK